MSALAAAPIEDVAPIAGGVFVAVVGPSGSGKDTLIAHARQALAAEPRVTFVRRVITRASDGATEDHDSVCDTEFEESRRAGAFALTWDAHGLRYGIPAGVDAAVASGQVAIANGSRGVIPALRARYARVVVAEIGASPEILAARLASRGRESRGEVLARLARTVPAQIAGPDVVAIDNSGDIAAAGARLVALIRAALAEAAPRQHLSWHLR